jgi:hypothetical protein
MAHNVHLTFELGIAFLEGVVDAIRLPQNDLGDLFPVCALIEEDVQREVGDEGPRESNPFDGDVFQGRV